MMKLLKTNIYGPIVRFKKIEFNDATIDELLHIQHNQLSSRVERWTY